MTEIILQEEIKVSRDWIDKLLVTYKGYKPEFTVANNHGIFSRDEIIKEVENLSEAGKSILMLTYNYQKWKNKT